MDMTLMFRALNELREGNDNLMAAVESQSAAVLKAHGPIAGPSVVQEIGFTVLESTTITEPSHLSLAEKDELRANARFDLECLMTCNHESDINNKRLRKFYRKCSKKSDYFNQDWGMYKVPANGRYRFDVKGRYVGTGKTELFICCDGENSKERRPIEVYDSEDSSASEPDESDLEEKRRVYKDEKRVSLFALDASGDNQERSIVFNAKAGLHVWLEHSLKNPNVDDDELYCNFRGCFLD